jgi:hypothetical protein
MPLFRERCQFENSIYHYAPPLGELRALKRAVRRLPGRFGKRAGAGKPSSYAIGDWVRVNDADAIRATLDGRGALRGMTFTGPQWAYCGKTFQVDGVVRRIMNDFGVMRAVGRTVSLVGVTCGGPHNQGGCGRACPLLFRDEWLEPSSAEHADPPGEQRYARVKALDAIRATLAPDGRRDGVVFVPEMAKFAGARLPVAKRVEPVRPTWWRRGRGEWYVLAGARCSGAILAAEGPCHRGCGLLWHRDWLEFE